MPLTLHFVGFVGGAERIDFTYDGARWTHLGAEGPSGITINGITWDIGVNPDLPNSGETAFLFAACSSGGCAIDQNSLPRHR